MIVAILYITFDALDVLASVAGIVGSVLFHFELHPFRIRNAVPLFFGKIDLSLF